MKYFVESIYKDFLIQKVVESKNEYHAVIDFMNELEGLLEYDTSREEMEKCIVITNAREAKI
ncbi:hypothetical protein MP619_04805 [Streptococcus dysgalactiae]|uniref:Uncharacterized protein n=1 Tax=Streptococcus dysgalactiae TaxID=1334 RepID=A0AAF0A1M5_STRDY|nr:hypothetical protein [Streptococcus dysgalactiae]QGH04821.1 hypothetical protein EA458_10425 [Streptococcus dysgalactiae subsp. dysgalactiae]WAI93921.1 hypothetical protein MP619_04805 [Streptococcus dysgalactiae]WCE86599.1 hypothetical protein PMN45_03185 [Streptococcus dysgalactiae]WCN26594.1 hypothetical protein PP188_03195 [Streptococcus dysgalactiae]